ncbi:MAG: hypothetical protein E6Q97_13345 [Desulfurellales bacterium]|nr:MAG: hypothetical protein E6Q97_13345 [Desulfurellales bacterium]
MLNVTHSLDLAAIVTAASAKALGDMRPQQSTTPSFWKLAGDIIRKSQFQNFTTQGRASGANWPTSYERKRTPHKSKRGKNTTRIIKVPAGNKTLHGNATNKPLMGSLAGINSLSINENSAGTMALTADYGTKSPYAQFINEGGHAPRRALNLVSDKTANALGDAMGVYIAAMLTRVADE